MTILKKGSLFTLLMVFAVMVSLTTMAEPGKKDKKQKDQDPALQQKKHAVAVAMLVDAKRSQITGNYDKAEELYQQVIEKFPEEAAAYFELGRINSDKKKLDEAVDYARKAASLDPENIWYQLFLAEVLQMNGANNDAINVYKKLLLKNPDNLEYLYQLSALYIGVEKYNDAIGIYNKLETRIGITEEISLQKEKIYLLLNETEKAEKELEKLVNTFPNETKYLSILAEFYLANKMQDKALETYKRVAQLDPNDPFIHMSLADFYKKTGDEKKAFEELKLGFANPAMNCDDKVKILLFFYSVDQLYKESKDQAFTLAEILVATHPNDPRSHSIYGDLLLQDNQIEQSRNEFIKAAKLDSSRYAVWEEILQLDLRLSKYDELASTGKTVIELFPEQPVPYLFVGMAYYQSKEYEKGVKVLNTGSKLVVNNDFLLAQFYMYLGDTYHALKRSNESDKAYEQSLALQDSNAYVLNNYSYYLSLRNERLEKAEEMSKKAVTLEPENPSFQDTYGWVLYKLGKYSEAKIWVGKAIQSKEAPSGEVLEHFGDILFKLGELSEALNYWEKAKEKGDASSLIEKKITEKKLYE